MIENDANIPIQVAVIRTASLANKAMEWRGRQHDKSCKSNRVVSTRIAF